MALSAYAVVNPAVIGFTHATISAAIKFQWERVHHPDLNGNQDFSSIIVDLNADNVDAIRSFSASFDHLPWGYGVLVNPSYGLRHMRQHFRSISNLTDVNGRSRQWFWSDPRFMKILLSGINDPASASLIFSQFHTYVIAFKGAVSCVQWDGSQVVVIEQ